MSWPPAPPSTRPEPAAPVVVAASDWGATRIVVVAAVGLVLVGIGFLASILSAIAGSTSSAAVAVFFGTLAAVLVLVLVRMCRKAFRPRKLIIEPTGIRWDDPKGTPWALPWHEAGAVTISTGLKREAVFVPVTLVRLDLWPRDPGFHARHPEMRAHWGASGGKGRYRVALGPRQGSLAAMVHALRSYAPPGLYRGVVNEGTVWGFRYS